MIKATIMEPSRPLLKTICFTDSLGGCFRIAYFDKNGVPVLERWDEVHLDKSRIQSTSILVGADYKLVAYRTHLWNSQNKPLGSEDYKLVDDEFQLINRCVIEIYSPNDPIRRKDIWYDSNNNPRYMCIEENDNFKIYTPDGQEIDVEGYGVFFYENLKDFETIDEIVQQILKAATEKLLAG
ncbi:hypothetical protein [Acinetobacter tjernbergiae]|uniref:Uncharacterized protein n=1 Tax=Acinetobacter tjernbergiae DSM 14971 = CIP 107465 TaxID=1120928 RepID=V2UJK0_9GAMM|nr:hypothetical protein [Acinetobacter tjernbergiae]ESK54893.1 hypothetical protein F990_02336 [Acinetobacter tjernbergiae DSM 14971 = CIP 107465]